VHDAGATRVAQIERSTRRPAPAREVDDHGRHPGDRARHAAEREAETLRAVRLYYVRQLTMDTIARELGTSRSTVSRMLDRARETGLVEFRIREPGPVAPNLQQRLAALLGLTVRVVPTSKSMGEAEIFDRVCGSAARYVSAALESNMTLAVAWGTTMNALSRHLPHKATSRSRVVQLNGAGNTHSSGVAYASQLLQRFGDAFTADVDQFPVPTFFDFPETKTALWRERSVQRVLELQAGADVAVFSVGAVHGGVPSHVYSGGYLEERDYATLVRERVVGDVATVFLREDGSSLDIALNARSSGPDLAVLAAIPRRICVASGRHRVRGLVGAIAAGVVSELILDEDTATELLRHLTDPAPRTPPSAAAAR
jgi:deoxyribonucleoside regulator